MTKDQEWKGSLKSIQNHIDPEREEHLKLMKSEIENQVQRILKLTKTINSGSKDRRLKKKSEVLTLAEDFQKQYEALLGLYQELRYEIKQNLMASGDGDNYRSSYDFDTEAFTTPLASTPMATTPLSSTLAMILDDKSQGRMLSDTDETVLKDKLTSSSEMKKTVNLDQGTDSPKPEESEEVVKDLRVEGEDEGDELKANVDLFRVKYLEGQVASLNSQKVELELKLRKKLEENEWLKSHVHSLNCDKGDLEERVKKLKHDEFQSNVENNDLRERFSALQASVSDREKELSDEREKLSACENSMTEKISILTEEVAELYNRLGKKQLELEQVRSEKQQLEAEIEERHAELMNRIEHQKKAMTEMEGVVHRLEKENKEAKTSLSKARSNFQLLEKKNEEMAEEFRKQFEDQYILLSRRINVVEQLQVEFKEWHRKTKEMLEKKTKDLKDRNETTAKKMKSTKKMALAANDVITSLDAVVMRFEQSTANFLNRISKSSCELKFAKLWAARKNKDLVHVREDVDCLVLQLHDKEGEILAMRERLWKSENKARELEKMINEKEDEMLVLIEEKREAIRQLCVWIDYHRGRSDYYKKVLSDKMNPTMKKAR